MCDMYFVYILILYYYNHHGNMMKTCSSIDYVGISHYFKYAQIKIYFARYCHD